MDEAETYDPDWDTPISVTISPDAIIHAVFWSADTVHTGWDSCVDASLIMSDTTAIDEESENYCRLTEQEFVEDDAPDVTWHDWVVELKLGEVYVTAHWQVQVNEAPNQWDWCAEQAEQAFSMACLLVGKRVRRGIVVESNPQAARAPRTHH